jgi:hypothetical protein
MDRDPLPNANKTLVATGDNVICCIRSLIPPVPQRRCSPNSTHKNPMSIELEQAFQKLEQRPITKGPPLERYTAEIWQFIDDRLSGYGPNWYRDLTQRYRIGGAYFCYPLDPERPYIGSCLIARPSSALLYVYDVWPLPQLFALGFCCFADGDDGNVWMFQNQTVDDPLVYFLVATEWDGSEPSKSNGLHEPEITLSQLLRYGYNWTPSVE